MYLIAFWILNYLMQYEVMYAWLATPYQEKSCYTWLLVSKASLGQYHTFILKYLYSHIPRRAILLPLVVVEIKSFHFAL